MGGIHWQRCLWNLKRVIPERNDGRVLAIEWGRAGMLRGLHGIARRYKWEPQLFWGTSIKCARDKWSSRPFFFAIGWPRGWSGSLTKRLSNHTLQQIVPKNWSEWFAKGNFPPVFSHCSSSSSGALKSRTWAKSFCSGLFFLKWVGQENDHGWHAKIVKQAILFATSRPDK